jgi:hypothetical protein
MGAPPEEETRRVAWTERSGANPTLSAIVKEHFLK